MTMLKERDNLKSIYASAEKTILIVDDCETNRLILQEHVAELGHRAVMAENGQAGLDRVESDTPDLVLVDMLMPIMDGCQMLKRLKAHPAYKDIPVIVISAVGEMGKIAECLEQGADDYLIKPVNFVHLDARLSSSLGKKESRDREEHYRRQLEEANGTISRQNKELRRINNMINKYIRMCSHELKNHLCAVGIHTELILTRSESVDAFGERNVRRLKTIRESASLMERIVNDSLDYHKVINDRITIKAAPINVAHESAETLMAFGPLASEKNIHISTTSEPNLPAALADAARVRQVISNFITNAIKYGPYDSRVTVSIRRAGNEVRLEVADDGPGIVESERNQLFQEFPEISTSPTGNEKSNGIGLAIVKKLIDAQGGSVGASFPESGGSVFWLQLPIANPADYFTDH